MSDLKQRTKLFALSIIRLYSQMPKTIEAQIIGKQFLRSGTSVVHIIGKPVEIDQMLNSSAKLKVAYRNLKKPCIGLNSLRKEIF